MTEVTSFLPIELFLAFRNIFIIDQYRVHVEHYVRTAAHQWLFSEYNDPTLMLEFNTFEVQIADLYENIDFSEA